MYIRARRLFIAVLVVLSGCIDVPEEYLVVTTTGHQEAQVLTILAEQQEAWNAGSLEGFMAGYIQSDSLRFISGNNIRTGWQEALEAYQRNYTDRETMGILTFDGVNVRFMTETWALVYGRWTLERAEDRPTGLFTLVFELRPEGWRIVHDHTSN